MTFIFLRPLVIYSKTECYSGYSVFDTLNVLSERERERGRGGEKRWEGMGGGREREGEGEREIFVKALFRW